MDNSISHMLKVSMKLGLTVKHYPLEADSSPVRAFLRALRVHFVPPSFLPAILCGIIPWSRDGVFDPLFFLLAVTGVTINHFGLNMIDDVFDYRQSVDLAGAGEKNPYAGGSGVLTSGLLTDRQLYYAALLCFAITALIGFYIAASKGWPVLAIGLFGLFCSIYYTAPPIRLGYRGLGELALLVNFGPVIGMGSYFVQAGRFDREPFFISLVLGFMMWSMIIINEMPDYEDDRRAGKFNLVARFGRNAGAVLYVGGLAAAYVTLAGSVISGLAPVYSALGFLSIPWAWRSVEILRRNLHEKVMLAPANLCMIKVHFITGTGLIAGYILNYFVR